MGKHISAMRDILWIAGRATRLEWWVTHVGILVALRIVGQLYVAANRASKDPEGMDLLGIDLAGTVKPLWYAISFLLLWVAFAGILRRLHDRGKSGWWSLLYLVPLIGWIWFYVECGFLAGQPRANRHGPVPRRSLAGAALETLFTHGPFELAALLIARRGIAAQLGEHRGITAQLGEHHGIAAQLAERESAAPPITGFGRRGLDPAPAAGARRATSEHRRPIAGESAAVIRPAPLRRNFAVIAIVAIAIVLGAATMFFSNFGIYAVVTPVGVNAQVPVFGADQPKP